MLEKSIDKPNPVKEGIMVSDEELVEPEDQVVTEVFKTPLLLEIIASEEISRQVEDIMEQLEEISEEQAETATEAADETTGEIPSFPETPE